MDGIKLIHWRKFAPILLLASPMCNVYHGIPVTAGARSAETAEYRRVLLDSSHGAPCSNIKIVQITRRVGFRVICLRVIFQAAGKKSSRGLNE